LTVWVDRAYSFSVSRLIDTLRLIRTLNCLLASAGVWIGARLTWIDPVYYGPTVASIAAFLICAAGNAANDLLDIEGDRTNHPRRVLVMGKLSAKYARNLALGLNAVALVMAASISLLMVVIALVTIGLLGAYNLRMKRIPLVGNVVVASLAAMTFLTGGLAVDPVLAFGLPGPLVAAAFALLFHLVREIVKDVQDMDGDRRAGLDSLPLRIGVSRALSLALGLFVVVGLLTYVPVMLNWYGDTYKIMVVFFIDLPLLALMLAVRLSPSPKVLAAASIALKAGMALGLAALVVA
jgi:geranylgeranylglycerol-phosphate geranylgeranyltransferase